MLDDFSGGLYTKAPLTLPSKDQADLANSKNSPDCLNVYSEGRTLRKRNGVSVLNPTASAGSGNGVYNWVRSATDQLLMTVFGSVTYKMDNSAGWDGMLDQVSNDATNGTAFSDAQRYFVTYNGTLIMTSEVRDTPQYMTTTQTSHFNLTYLGAGTTPLGKYLQVWKEHVWLLNIGQGGTLTEECDSITPWTSVDVAPGASSQITFQGNSTFKFQAGNSAGKDAVRNKIISGGISDDYSVDAKVYLNTVSNFTGGDYAELNFQNGVVNFKVAMAQDGLKVNDGTNWLTVSAASMTGVFDTYKFFVTGGTATGAVVDIFRNNSPIAISFPVTSASAVSDGKVTLAGRAGGSASTGLYYLDHLYINSINARTNYLVNGGMEAYTAGIPNSWFIYPTQPMLHFKLNDNAASSVVTNNGTSGNNGVYQNTAGAINTNIGAVTGKIGTALSFTSASGQHMAVSNSEVTSVMNDSIGSISFWAKLTAIPTAGAPYIFSVSADTGTEVNLFSVRVDTARLLLTAESGSATFYQTTVPLSLSTGTFYHFGITKGSALNFYISGSTSSYTLNSGTGIGNWIVSLGTATALLTRARIGATVSTTTTVQVGDFVVDDFRYYRTEITSDEMGAIYAEGNGNETNAATTSDSTTFQIGSFSLKMNSIGNYAVLVQTLSAGTALAGGNFTFGGWFKTTASQTYRLQMEADSTIFQSATFSTTTAFNYRTLSFTPPSGTAVVKAKIIVTSAGTVNVDQLGISSSDLSGTNTDNSDRLQRSAVTFYNDWSGTDSGYNDITTPGDVGLTGSGILNDRMYVFKKWSVHRITYTGSTPLLDIKQAKKTVGTASPRSIKNIDIPGSGEVLIFLGTDKRIYLFDGYSTIPISDNISISNGISSIYLNNINSQALDKVYAVIHSDKNWYELFAPLGSSTLPANSIVIDFSTGKPIFWPNDNRNFKSGDVSDNGIGSRIAYVQGNTDGNIYLTNSTNSDNGTAINGYWTSFKCSSPVLLTRIDEIEVQTDSVVCTPTFGWRMDWEISYTTKTLAASSYSNNYDPSRIDNLTQFKISDNSSNATFKLWSIGLYERILGGGK